MLETKDRVTEDTITGLKVKIESPIISSFEGKYVVN